MSSSTSPEVEKVKTEILTDALSLLRDSINDSLDIGRAHRRALVVQAIQSIKVIIEFNTERQL